MVCAASPIMSWNVPRDPGADQQIRQGPRTTNGAVTMSCVSRHRPTSAHAVAIARAVAGDVVARATVAGACWNTGGLGGDAILAVGVAPFATGTREAIVARAVFALITPSSSSSRGYCHGMVRVAMSSWMRGGAMARSSETTGCERIHRLDIV